MSSSRREKKNMSCRKLFVLPLLILFLWGSVKITVAKADPLFQCHVPTVQLPQDQALIQNSLAIIQNKTTLGSGIIVSPDGYIFTAAHVVAPAKQVAVYLHNGDVLTGQVLEVNEPHDAALVKISGSSLPCRPFQTNEPKINTRIYSAGLSFESSHMMYRLTSGYVLSVQQGLLQTTARPISGNSGGAFLNAQGEVVGLIAGKTQFLSQKMQADRTHTQTHNGYSYGAATNVLQQMLQPFFVSYYPTG
jgi:S1-C subfamily serine protease